MGFTYMRGDLLQGHARSGGMGVLPIQQHIDARRAVWAVRLLMGEDSTPWVTVGRYVMQHSWGRTSPWHAMLPAMHTTVVGHPDVQQGGREMTSILPGPLSWMFAALHSLPTMVMLRHTGLPAQEGPTLTAAQSWHVPLLGNPYVFCSTLAASAQIVAVGGEADPRPLALRALADVGVHTLGHLLRMLAKLTSCADDLEWQQAGPLVGTTARQPSSHALFDTRARALGWVQQVLQSIPAQWVQDACTMPGEANMELDERLLREVASTLMHHLQWPIIAAGQSGCHYDNLSVRLATELLLQPVRDERHSRWHAFVSEAVGEHAIASHPPAAQVNKMLALLRKLWRLGWHNGRKELYWRLIVNSLPFSARFNRRISCVCNNGNEADNPGRMHHFWDCAAAKAVVGIMERECCEGVALQRQQLWLMIPPPALRARYGAQPWLPQLWRVVCLAALNSMWWAAQSVLQNDHSREPRTALVPRTTSMLCTKAILQFRVLLEEFACVGRPPHAWTRLLPGDAPFFRVNEHGDMHVCVDWG